IDAAERAAGDDLGQPWLQPEHQLGRQEQQRRSRDRRDARRHGKRCRHREDEHQRSESAAAKRLEQVADRDAILVLGAGNRREDGRKSICALSAIDVLDIDSGVPVSHVAGSFPRRCAPSKPKHMRRLRQNPPPKSNPPPSPKSPKSPKFSSPAPASTSWLASGPAPVSAWPAVAAPAPNRPATA